MINLFPSLSASNLLTLEKTAHQLSTSCSGFHIDIMDSIFVSPDAISRAIPVDKVRALRCATPLPLWFHLMVAHPHQYVSRLILHQHDIVSIHYESESVDELKELFRFLKQRDVVRSCALKPHTPIAVLKNLIGCIDHVLIMSVEPGASGQNFLPATIKKLDDLSRFQHDHGVRLDLGVDGGINFVTIKDVLPYQAMHRVTDIALGASLFFGNNPEEKLAQFLTSCKHNAPTI